MAYTTNIQAEQFDAMHIFPRSARVVLLADVVSSGALCRKFFAALAPRRVVAVVTAIHLTGDRTFNLRGCPLMAGLTIPISAVDPVSLLAVDQFDAELLFSAGGRDLGQQPIVTAITGDMKQQLALHPEAMHELSPRKFEELIAAILADHGFTPELQKMTRDGGKDIIAIKRGANAPFVVFVQCKRWSPERPVGVGCVRELHSVSITGKANRSLLVTTSTFTKDAVKYSQIIGADFELGDFERLQSILGRYRR